MSNVLNRKMFVKGYRGGSSVRSEPRGARPESVYDSAPFKPILGVDFLSGIVSGYKTASDAYSKDQAYITRGLFDQVKDTFRASPDYGQDMFNYILAPIQDINRKAVDLVAGGVFGLDRGIVPSLKGETEKDQFAKGKLFGLPEADYGRFKTENNPYGFPSQFGMNPISFFAENFPVGSQKRLNFLIGAVRQPNFQSDLAKIGVGTQEIKAAEKALVNEFKKARAEGLSDEEAAAVYDFPEPPPPPPPFKDVKTGDLSLMEDLAKEGPFPQPQLDLTRGGESPFRVDKRTKDLINLLGGKDAETNDEIVNEETQEVLDSNTAATGTQSEANFVNKTESQNDIANRKAGEFDFEEEVGRFKDLLRESTEVDDKTTPALLLLQLASNLVSGKTSEKGFAGFLDVLGQASGPVLDTAVKLAQDKKAYERELGASAVQLAFEKEQDILDRAATIAADQAKLNEPFATTKYLRKINFAPNGAIMSYSPDFIAVNSREEFNKLNAIQPIQLSDGTVIMDRPYAMFDDQKEKPFYYGVRDQEEFFSKSLPIMNQQLNTINFITAIQGEDLVDNNTGKAIVGPKALLDLGLARAGDFISALTNNVDTQQLFSKQEAADFELAFSTIDGLDAGDEEKAKMKQDLLLQSQGVNYDQQLIDALNQEVFQADIFEGFTMNEILTNPQAVDDYMKAKGLTENSTLPVANQFGETTLVRIGDVKQDAQDTFNFLTQMAAEEGIEFRDGRFMRPEPTNLEKYDFTIGGKTFSVNPKVFQLGLKSKILGIQFARFQQPEQRLLKDTIESSIGEFQMSSLFRGPQELNSKLQEFKERAVQKYNSMVEQNFQTEAPGVYDLYKWQPNKVSVFKTPITAGVVDSKFMINPKLAEQSPSVEQVNQNDLQSTGQNISAKVEFFDLEDILNQYGVTY